MLSVRGGVVPDWRYIEPVPVSWTSRRPESGRPGGELLTDLGWGLMPMLC